MSIGEIDLIDQDWTEFTLSRALADSARDFTPNNRLEGFRPGLESPL